MHKCSVRPQQHDHVAVYSYLYRNEYIQSLLLYSSLFELRRLNILNEGWDGHPVRLWMVRIGYSETD